MFFSGRGWHNGKQINIAMETEFMFVSKIPLRFAAKGEQVKYKAIWKCQSGQKKLATRQKLQKLLHTKSTKISF